MFQASKRFHVFAIGALSVVLTACAPSGKSGWEDNTEGRLQVAATFSILGDLAEQVGGDRVMVRTLVPVESDPHSFDASPAESRTLAGADLLVEIGHDFEPWLDRLYRACRSTAYRVVLTEGLALVPADRGHAAGHAGNDCRRAEKDPHAWHDVRKTMKMVDALRRAFSEADPENTGVYEANAERYLAELAELDAWIVTRTGELRVEERKLFTHHDVFEYFARRYGFDVVGTALTATTTAVFDPSASQVGSQIRTIRAVGLHVVFPEVGSSSQLISRIAGDAGARIGPPLYTDSLSREGGEASSYIAMMRYNVETLVDHLSAGFDEL